MTDQLIVPPKQKRMTSEEQLAVAIVLRRKYIAGATVRDLAAEYGRSYYWAYRLLGMVSTPMRSTGVPKGKR